MHNTASPKGNHMENAQQPVRNKNGKTQKLPKSRISFWVTPIVFLIFFIGLFTLFAIPMGLSNMLSIRSFDRYMSLHHGDRSHHGCSFRTAHGVRCCCNAQSPAFPAYEAYIRPARCCRSRHSHNLSFRQSCNSFSRGRSRFSQVLQEISALRPD